MSVRGPTGKFFYDRIHDLYLYHLTLEAALYDEEKDELVYTSSGEIKMEGGWPAIAEKMTAVFGRDFKASQIRARFEKFSVQDDYLRELFEAAVCLRDDMETIQSVIAA